MWDKITTTTTRAFSKVKSQTGVTIMEVMIAVIILTIALLGLLGMGVVALEGNQWANYSTKSTQLLSKKIEELRSSGNPQSGEEQIDDITLTWVVTTPGSYLRGLTVRATWTNQRNEQVGTSISTVMKTSTI